MEITQDDGLTPLKFEHRKVGEMAAVPENVSYAIHFGTFEVDLQAGELRRNGSKVKLQEQPFQILTVLLERPGTLVTREELQKRLWPAYTFVDFDHGLNAAIRRLRDALGDSAENPRFVETVSRRGYRFVAPVNGQNGAETAQPVPRASSERRHLILWAFLILCAGAIAGAIFVNWPRASIQFSQRRLTANLEDHPVWGSVISPDGKYLAFTDNTGFYLRETDSGETHALNALKGFLVTPRAWYPDGIRLLVTAIETPQSPPSLWQISIMGDPPRKLIDDARVAALSRDGSRIAFVRPSNFGEELWIMQADGENPRKLPTGQRSGFGQPAWSPDGRRIVYPVTTYEAGQFGATTGISVLDLASGRPDSVVPPDNHSPMLNTNANGVTFGHGLLWTRDNHLIFSVSELRPNQADSNLWSVRLDNRGHMASAPVRLTATPDVVGALSATEDEKRIAFTKYSENPDVYVAELVEGGRRLSPPRQLTLDQRRDYPFAWTPDNKEVLFASDRSGLFHIFKQGIDQSVPELLVGGDDAATSPRLTPDSSAVIYVIWPKLGESSRESRLMKIPIEGGPPRLLLQRADLGNVQCARLPSTLCMFDVRKETELSFFRFDPVSGKYEEMPRLTIHDQPSYAYNWSLSPDGKLLALAKQEAVSKVPTITLLSTEDGTQRAISVQAWAGIGSIDFSADGRSLLASAHTNTWKWALLKIDLEGRTTTLLEDPDMKIGWAIPAPDGRHLALWKSRGTANVWMLERK